MVTIVGAGLAGSILSKVLSNAGISHNIYDCRKEWRASPISENLFSMSWKKTLGDDVFNNGIKTLESVANIEAIRFKTKGGYNNTLHVPANKILVEHIYSEEIDVNALCKIPGIVIDCRGYWAEPVQGKMVGLTGQGLFIKGSLKQEPIMNFVSPYVHQKLFAWDYQTIWYGDSTCIEYDKYIAKQKYYETRCMERARALIDFKTYTMVHGIRPWVKGNKGYLHLSPKRIVNTGGWKCGMIIYADQAQKILTYIKSL